MTDEMVELPCSDRALELFLQTIRTLPLVNLKVVRGVFSVCARSCPPALPAPNLPAALHATAVEA